jgi:hypothetical protein
MHVLVTVQVEFHSIHQSTELHTAGVNNVEARALLFSRDHINVPDVPRQEGQETFQKQSFPYLPTFSVPSRLLTLKVGGTIHFNSTYIYRLH